MTAPAERLDCIDSLRAVGLRAWVGRVSHGGYLFHALVLWALHQVIDTPTVAMRLVLLAAALPLTVGLASLSYVAFEQPVARRWRNAFAAGSRTQRLPAHAGA